MKTNAPNLRPNGQAIVALRMKDGLSQLELSRLAGVSQSYLSEIENGTKRTVSPAVARRLAEALSVRMGAITTIDEAGAI